MTEHSWLKAFRNRLLSSRRSRSSRVSMSRPRSIPVVLEKLEDRTLLAAAVLFGNGVLQVLSDADEDIVIREDLIVPGVLDVRVDGIPASSLGSVTTDQVTSIIVTVGASENTVDLTAVTAAAFPNVTRITVSTGNGDDVIFGSPDFANEVDAGDGDDLIIGGGLDDSLDGGDGNDTITGGAGNDLLDAGDGDDLLSGDEGADTLLGDDGEDTLLGGPGSDNIQAGNGRDILNGGDGDDTLNGGGGADIVLGGPTAGLTVTSPTGGQTLTFNELMPSASGTTISIDFVDAAVMSGTLVSSVTGIGTSAVLITIELGDDGTAITATGADIVAAVNADATASSLVTVVAAGPEEIFVSGSLGALAFSGGGGGGTAPPGGSFGTPILNFAGAGFNGSFPPDTNGDVGPNHFIQTINATVVTIFNKDGSQAFAPFALSSLAPAGSTVTGSGDPIVVYDELADRWVLMEFSGPSATDVDEIYVYVSQTPTPTNNPADWFFFEFTFPVPGGSFPDYPKLAVWPDGYYITTNEAGTSDPPVYVLDRVNMLQGLTPRPFQRVTTPALAGFGFQALTPVDLDGSTAPPLGNPAYMLRHRDDEAHNVGANDPNQDFIELYAYSTDLANAANSTFQLEASIPVSEFDSDLNGLFSFSAITQPGGNTPLDPLREVVMWRPSYRNFGTHETIVGNFVTDVDGTDHAGVRWFELRRTGGGAWQLFQEGTISPDADNRWMGAIAMDADGNIALAYSVSGPTTNPGLRYIGRRASDPLGTMPRGEFVIIDGLSPQVGVDRWGDYHSLSVDPSDGSTFWFTGQYGANNTWTTQVATFAFAASVTTTTPPSSGVDDDLIFGGGGADTLFGLAGNDRIRGNGGDDLIEGGLGADTLSGQGGSDIIDGGEGDDVLNGNQGNDTLIGEDGNDVARGGGGDDLLFGDGSDTTSSASGNDTLLGNGGDDTLIGVTGIDLLDGGAGSDLVRSTFGSSVDNTVAPVQPTPPPPPPGATSGSALDDAVDSGMGTVVGGFVTLSNGPGDGTVDVSPNAAGSFFGAPYDPVGPIPPATTTFDSDVFFRSGTIGSRSTLTNAASNLSAIRATQTEANSTFTIGGLSFALTQLIEPLTSGSLLTQTYRITNTGTVQENFELVRYMDADLNFDGTLIDGGGILTLSSGQTLLFETDAGGNPSSATTFLGITAVGGNVPAMNFFELDSFSGLRQRIALGTALDDIITGDGDGDGFVDFGSEFDVTLGLINTFALMAGESGIFTTHTLFGSGAPNAIMSNVPPVAVNDTAQVVTDVINSVVIDVVSNDTDSDGVPIFSTVTITQPPLLGTAVSLGNGLIQYTSNTGLSATDVFSYTIADNNGGISNEATVTITVTSLDTDGDTLRGSSGSDTLIGASGDELIVGGSGSDVLEGVLGNDTLLGGAGPDTLRGGGGNDVLDGQGGNDLLDGGDGADILRWDGLGDGRDTVFGGNGPDQALASLSNGGNTITIGQDVNGRLTVTEQSAVLTVDNTTVNSVVVRGNNGADRITVGALNLVGRISLLIDGGNGNDTIDAMGSNIGSVVLEIMGGVGADTLGGGPSNDRISGGVGDDSIVGRNGRDTLFGNDGADTINGGADDDLINGGANNDTILGESGDDRIDGGLDSDNINGGDGNDTLLGNFGDDLLNGMAGNDSLLGGSGQDIMLGGAGMDTLDGGRNNDTLRGQAGNDTLRGNHGDDLLEGDDGNDELVGGDGNDTIRGSNGNDGIAGGDGDDLLIGGLGEDTIRGEDGNDTLRGGGGKDTLVGDQGIDVLNGNGGTDLGVTGQGIDPTPIRVEIIDENFTLSVAMLLNLDGV